MEGWKMDWKENGRCIHDITLIKKMEDVYN
jgi:hypothetical protein